MADNDLKIWQNHLLLNLFHMVDAKFDLVLRSIQHGNPAMPFLQNKEKGNKKEEAESDREHTQCDRKMTELLI